MVSLLLDQCLVATKKYEVLEQVSQVDRSFVPFRQVLSTGPPPLFHILTTWGRDPPRIILSGSRKSDPCEPKWRFSEYRDTDRIHPCLIVPTVPILSPCIKVKYFVCIFFGSSNKLTPLLVTVLSLVPM